MQEIPTELLKLAYLQGSQHFIIKDAQAGAAAGLTGAALAQGIWTVVKDVIGGLWNASTVIAGLFVGFSIGLSQAITPVGETLGRGLKTAPTAPLTAGQIKNMLIHNRLLNDSMRVRQRKELEVAGLAEKLIKEKFNLP